jgi:hypothetical protein
MNAEEINVNLALLTTDLTFHTNTRDSFVDSVSIRPAAIKVNCLYCDKATLVAGICPKH